MRIRIILLSFFTISLLTGCGDDSVQLSNGQAAPAFELQQIPAGTVNFPADYRDNIVALRFWADWCPFCESEMKALEPVYQKYQQQGLVVLAINVRQDRNTAQQFMDKLSVSYPAVLDSEGEVARVYGVMGLPTTFLVNRQGLLQQRILGESTPQVFEQVVQELLKQ